MTANISTYLTRELRSEEQARFTAECDAARKASAARADEAAAAFFAVAQTASLTALDTARLLNRAKAFSDRMWKHEDLTEEESDAKLLEECLRLCDGDELKARLLASAVLA